MTVGQAWFGTTNPAQGQVFTTPTLDTYLKEFSFAFASFDPDISPLFELYRWDGTGPDGSALVSESLGPFPAQQKGVATWTGGVELDPESTDLAMLQIGNGQFGIWTRDNGSYADGTFSFFVPASSDWYVRPRETDAWFSASLDPSTSPVPGSVTPEPMTLLLLGTGLVGIAGVAYRRRREGGYSALA